MKLSHLEFMTGIRFINTNELIASLDRDFGLTTLHNKDGNFIKVIE
jgi:hypothetical protein